MVGREIDNYAAARQCLGQRLRREKMASGAPGGDQHQRRGPGLLRA